MAWMKRSDVRLTGVVVVSALWLAVTLLGIISDGSASAHLTSYIVPILVAGLVLGGRAAVVVAGLSVLTAFGLYRAEINDLMVLPLVPSSPFGRWAILSGNYVVAALLLVLVIKSANAALLRARRLSAELSEQRMRLEDAVAERTLQLELRARYLEATAEVARDATSVLDLQELLTRTVTLVSERFGFYHSGIFILDPSGEWAELRAASSEGGQRMLAREHRLRVREQGIVGYVAGHGEPRIALDVGADAAFFGNPDLPDTRSEMALPLKARGETIGVLDVQSRESQAFSEEDVSALQTLADQIAIAISNARLFRRVQESLEAERRAYGQATVEGWKELLKMQSDLGFRRDSGGTTPIGDAWQSQMETDTRAKKVILDEAGTGDLTVPLEVRGHVIGVISARKATQAGRWTQQEIEMMQTLAEQLDMALDNARLYQQTQRKSIRDQQLREIGMRMQSQVRLDDMLQTLVADLAKELGVPSAFVQLNTGRYQAEP